MADGSLPMRAAPTCEPLVDGFGRAINYLRVSVTDRCDLRCTYCMSEHMQFLPKRDLLTLEELDRVCSAFVRRGVRKLRLTGGEPLLRKGFLSLVDGLGRHLDSGALDEIALTTNGSRLAEHAQALADAGVRRVNVSLDTVDAADYRRITRGGDLAKAVAGIDAALAAGLKVKINTVALLRDNADSLPALIAWAHGRGCALTLIETMPLGAVDEDRTEQYVPLSRVRDELSAFWTLHPLPHSSGGPARYVRVEETGGVLGFITPLTQNFCASCNRVRLDCTGVLHGCLGRAESTDLRLPLRMGLDDAALEDAIVSAIARKPERHDFRIERGAAPALPRHMSLTGG